MGIYKKSIDQTRQEIAEILDWRASHQGIKTRDVIKQRDEQNQRLCRLRKKLKGMTDSQKHIKNTNKRPSYHIPLINPGAFKRQ